MGQTLTAAIASGLALTGVLAVAGVAAARLGTGFPHLGVAAVGAGAAMVAGRFTGSPAIAVPAVLAAGAVGGTIAWWLGRRLPAAGSDFWPPALLPEVVLLGVGIGLGSLLRPDSAVELPLGVLGGVPSRAAAGVAAAVGLAGAVALGSRLLRGRSTLVVWNIAAVGIALAVAVGSGMLRLDATPGMPAFGVPDLAGIALRAVAVGFVAVRGLWWGIGAAVVLGLGESLLRATWSLGDLLLAAALLIIVAGLRRGTDARAPAAA